MKNPNPTIPDQSIFPDVHLEHTQFNFPAFGLTKREHFASLAMAKLADVSNPEWKCTGHDGQVIMDAEKATLWTAKMAVRYADALIKELNEIPVFDKKEIL